MGKRKSESDVFRISDEEAEELRLAGAAPGLGPRAARMNGAMNKIFGRTHGPTPDEDTIAFLNNFDKHMAEYAKEHGLELRDED